MKVGSGTLHSALLANYEQVVAILDDGAGSIITRYETSEQPPNFILRDLDASSSTPLTQIARPEHTLPYSSKEQVHYTRSDGVPLSGTHYLPVGYQKGRTVPTIVWAYPRQQAGRGPGAWYLLRLSGPDRLHGRRLQALPDPRLCRARR